ncbi:hypothetical protein KBC70_01300 [Candidatus Woesebacteria bacterium]|nr:hypothetical protein [Candidatus Woesebacteria bacterium]
MTLSEFSYYVRKFGPFALIGFVVFIIFYLIISALITSISNRPVVVEYQPPFGQLDPIVFSRKIDYPSDISFTLENLEGRPVTSTSSALVFPMLTSRTRFGYQQTIGYMARAVGVDIEKTPYSIDALAAIYNDGVRKLTINITDYNFTFETDYNQIGEVFSTAVIPAENTIREEARSFMRQMNKFSSAFAQGRDNIIYLRYDQATQDFIVVKNPEDANVVEVDFFPPDVDVFPNVTPKYYNSQNYVTFVFRPEGNVIIKAQVSNYAKDFANGGYYPLKTGDQAYQELIDRKATIVSTAKGSNKIVIRDMFVGYYDPEVFQPYYMPVYVFLGDDGFVAYVSAVEDMYVKSLSATPSP